MLKRNTKNLSIALLAVVMVLSLAIGLGFTPKTANAATTGALYDGSQASPSVPENLNDTTSGVQINFIGSGSLALDTNARATLKLPTESVGLDYNAMLKVPNSKQIQFVVPANVTLEIKYIIGSGSSNKYYGFFDEVTAPSNISSTNGVSTGSTQAKKENGSNASFYWDGTEHTQKIEGGASGRTKYICFKEQCCIARLTYSITIANANQWTVTYDTQGGSAVNPQNVDKTAGTVNVNLSSVTPTKDGYRFIGWNTNKDATTAQYNANQTISISDNITLYAIWQKVSTISFETNGAGTIEDETKLKGEKVTLPTLTKANATFKGWSTTQNGSVEYKAGAEFTVGETDVTFYAIWEQSSYTVTFDGINKTVTVDKNSTIGTLPNAPTAPEGMEFDGWYTEKDGKGTEVTTAFKPSADIKVYPKWVAITYTITVDLNGHNVSDVPTSAKYGETVTLPQTIDGKFIKWSVDGADISGNTFTMPANNVNVVLVELVSAPGNDPSIEDVTVTFKDMSGKTLGSIKVDKGSKIDAYEHTYAQVPEGSLRFGGWYLDNAKNTHGNKFDFDEDLANENLTLYALWIDPVDTESFKNYIDYIMDTTKMPSSGVKPVWGSEGFKGSFNYIDGVFFNGLVTLYYQETNATKKEEYKKFFLDYVGAFVDSEGYILKVSKSSTSRVKMDANLEGSAEKRELDFICEAKILFDAYELSGNEKYIKAIEKYYGHLTTNMGDPVKGSYGNYSHKASGYTNQVWLDGMYMYAPYNARYLSATNADTQKFYDLRRQFEFIYDKMKAENGLYYHAFTQENAVWAADNDCSTHFWSRSVGWLTMGLVDVIEYFPEGDDKDFLKKMLNELLDSLISFKDKDTDMFYQLVDQDTFVEGFTKQYLSGRSVPGSIDGYTNDRKGSYYDRNYLETSGSSMIAYALMKGARLGYLNKGTYNYRQEGEETFEGIYNHSLVNEGSNVYHLYDICKMAGLDKSGGDRDGSTRYYLTGEAVTSDDGKGLGPFILAFIEYANESPTAPKTPDIRQKTVTFKNGESEVGTLNTYVNKTITALTAPTESGKTFSHWSTYPNGEPFDFSTPIEDNLTLYAVWEGEQFAFTKTFSKGEEFTTPSELSGYTFVGWTNDSGVNIYGSGQNVPESGEYFALYGKTTFLGGSIRTNAPTGVRFGFSVEFANVTSSEILTNIVGNMRAEYKLQINGKDTIVPAKRCYFDKGAIIMNVVIVDGADGLSSKSEIPITASLSVNVAGNNIATASGEKTIKQIAEAAYKAKQIDKTTAAKYGYKV